MRRLKRTKELRNALYCFPALLAFSTHRKTMRVKHTMLPIGLSLIKALTVLIQTGGQKAKETEMGVTLFTKMVREGRWAFQTLESNMRAVAIEITNEENYKLFR